MTQIDPKRVHLIERDGLHMLFCKDTLEFFQIPAEVAEEARPVIEEDQEFVDPGSLDDLRAESRRSLQILQFNVAEDCNLRCAYCIADGGRYGRDARAMSPETAVQALDVIFDQYEQIQSIQFFGGEPLMNLPTIRRVVEYIRDWQEEHPEQKAPYLNINTNGTILNDEMIELIQEHSIKVVVSIDGPAEIHDTFRKNHAGEATFDQIVGNIQRLHAATGRPDAYELVWGAHFPERGWGLRKTLAHLEELVPTEKHVWYAAPLCSTAEVAPHLHEYRGFQEGLISEQIEMVQAGFADLRAGRKPIFDSHARKLIRGIMNRKPSKLICGPAVSKLMVDATGKLYPCNALVDREAYLIGDVRETNREELGENLERVREEFLAMRKTTYHGKCASCWAFNLCSFCMGHLFRGEKPEIAEVPEEICATQRALAEEVLVEIGKLAQESELWERFKEYVGKM